MKTYARIQRAVTRIAFTCTAFTRTALTRIAVVASVLALPSLAFAQTAARTDTIYLDMLHTATEVTDRRDVQIDLVWQQAVLRMQTIRNERLPSFSGTAMAQYLSDVASVSSALGGVLPGGIQIPSPYHDQYDASVTARQPLFDATRSHRISVENAQANEAVARIGAALWQTRPQVNDAFFAILLSDAQQRSIDAAVVDLNARKLAAQERVASGTSLQSEVWLLDAEITKRNQSKNELRIARDAALSVLNALTGMTIVPSVPLAVRDALVPLPKVEDTDTLHARREYEVYQRERETIKARTAELSASELPKVSAFGRVGYGRPGLNQLGRSFDAYWNAGLQVEWSPLNWGRTKRDLEVQRMQADIVGSDEAYFTETVKRAALGQQGQINALEQSLAMDDSILSLRDRVLAETRLRFDEGEITSADYIARQTEYLSAQLDRDTRRVRLSEARVSYLTTIGRRVR